MTPSRAKRSVASTQRRVTRAGFRAHVEILLWRHGVIWLVGLTALLAAALLEALHLRAARTVLAQDLQAVARAQLSSPTKPSASANAQEADPAQQLARLEGTLRSAGRIDEQMSLIVGAARRHGIELPRGEYRSGKDATTRITRSQATFSVRAAYPSLRAFVEDVLRALPNASIDHIAFKRDAVAQQEVEATIKVSFWTLDGEGIRPNASVAPPRSGL